MPLLSGGFVHFMPNIPKNWILPGILLLFAVLLTGQALLQRYQTILNSRIQQRFIRSLRMDVYTSFMKELLPHWRQSFGDVSQDPFLLFTNKLNNAFITSENVPA
jgi:hypothetical protein